MNTIFYIWFVLLVASTIVQANNGCMDNQNRSRKDGNDHKNYPHVSCMCSCERYAWSSDRCCCENCKHFHDPMVNYPIKRN